MGNNTKDKKTLQKVTYMAPGQSIIIIETLILDIDMSMANI